MKMNDKDIAKEMGKIEAISFLSVCGIKPTERREDVDPASWDALEARLGREIYGYDCEGAALGAAWIEGWEEEMTHAE